MFYKTWTIVHISFFVSFLISGLLVNAIQASLYLLLPVKTFLHYNRYLVWILHAQFLFLADWWSNSKLRVHVPKDQKALLERLLGREKAIVLLNHHYETDWLFGWMMADRYGVLGAAKSFLKRVLRNVPVIGWAWGFADFVFLYRDWNRDKEILPESIRVLQNYDDAVWLLMFAEGTRWTPEKYAASKEFAASRPELPDLKHHLIPRTKGFALTAMSLDTEKIPAIYDVTLVADPANTTLFNALSGVPMEADMYVRRISTDTVERKNRESASKALMEIYREKDSIMDDFITKANFGPDSVQLDLPGKRYHSLVLTVVLNALIALPLWYGAALILVYGSRTQMTIILVVLGSLHLLMKKMIEVTKNSKASDYGKKIALKIMYLILLYRTIF